MRPPQGYNHPPNKVCRLRRALYGLKQALRASFEKFSSTVHHFGFAYSLWSSSFSLSSQECILLLLYVNDMINTDDDFDNINDLKSFLNQNFEMKDLGYLSYFLGLEGCTILHRPNMSAISCLKQIWLIVRPHLLLFNVMWGYTYRWCAFVRPNIISTTCGKPYLSHSHSSRPCICSPYCLSVHVFPSHNPLYCVFFAMLKEQCSMGLVSALVHL